MRWIYILTLPLIISACTQYKQVLIPTVCEIPQKQKPSRSGNVLEDFKAILMYLELLEKDVDFCTQKQPP